MNPTPAARKRQWTPTHTMTTNEYNITLDILAMLEDYSAITSSEYEAIRQRIDRMVE